MTTLITRALILLLIAGEAFIIFDASQHITSFAAQAVMFSIVFAVTGFSVWDVDMMHREETGRSSFLLAKAG